MSMVSAEVAQQAPLIEPIAGEPHRPSPSACFVARFALEHSIAWDSDAMQPHEIADTLGVIADAYAFAQDMSHPQWQGRHRRLAAQGAATLDALQLRQPVAAFRKEHAINQRYNAWLDRAHHYGGIFYADYAAACSEDPRLGKPAEPHPLFEILCKGGMSRSEAALAVLMAQRTPAWIAQAFGKRTAKSLKAVAAKGVAVAAEHTEEYDPLSRLAAIIPSQQAHALETIPEPRESSEPKSRHSAKPTATEPELQEPKPERRLLSAEEEVILAKRIEAGVFARKVLERLTATGQTGKMISDAYVTLQDFELIAKDGQSAFARFLEANTGLINRMLRSGQIQNVLHAEELVLDDATRASIIQDVQYNQREGLWHAVEKFDFTAGNKFSTYAFSNWVRRGTYAAIASELGYSLDGNDFEALQRVRRQLSDPTQRNKPLAERAKSLGVHPSLLIKLQDIAFARRGRMPSLEAPLRDDKNEQFSTLADTLDEPDLHLPTCSLDSTTMQFISEALDTLSPRERELVMFRFSGSAQPYSYVELARKYGCSPSTLETSYSRGIKKLHKFLGAKLPHLAQTEATA